MSGAPSLVERRSTRDAKFRQFRLGMRTSCLALATALGALAASPAVGGEPHCSPPLLTAHPAPTTATLRAGETRLQLGAIAYRPASAPAGPLPLVILLHGTGGEPAPFLKLLEPQADRRGLVLLAPRAKSGVWDIMENLAARRDPWSGTDSCRIDRVLADLFERTAIDPKRLVLLGFSDGASYALSLGTANPQLFTAVIALSPGYFVPPRRVYRPQRIFIAHGRHDSVLSFANTKHHMVDVLHGAGVEVHFRPFDGDHQISRSALDEALDYALTLQAPVPPPTSPPK